ncbi:uncharacterized protein LY79DRAFT_566159 [Colletotrichum navitas]|uniref:Uncharacterized protein n=1 Tax=Colletotrichum navitas TaxID=681940 RepID=A0AAD8PQA8_9PEZI|nr:uncharacterized protein LY79DRAFT_566159 [Colletotrichum navitas]KAK1574405.1 hypothetical protein LY79DRAFT_566159 [Colletotrichum navitas]
MSPSSNIGMASGWRGRGRCGTNWSLMPFALGIAQRFPSPLLWLTVGRSRGSSANHLRVPELMASRRSSATVFYPEIQLFGKVRSCVGSTVRGPKVVLAAYGDPGPLTMSCVNSPPHQHSVQRGFSILQAYVSCHGASGGYIALATDILGIQCLAAPGSHAHLLDEGTGKDKTNERQKCMIYVRIHPARGSAVPFEFLSGGKEKENHAGRRVRLLRDPDIGLVLTRGMFPLNKWRYTN